MFIWYRIRERNRVKGPISQFNYKRMDQKEEPHGSTKQVDGWNGLFQFILTAAPKKKK